MKICKYIKLWSLLFMKTKKLFSILIIAMIAILMLTAVMSTVTAVDAASKVKVTWNANGGKIGNSKIVTTSVTKGAKIGKLPKTPKKTGYVFKGWYTKKTGGMKITTTTHIKKKMTYYAQWKKKSNANDNSLIGGWKRSDMFYDTFKGTTSPRYFYYNFKKDGTFTYFEGSSVAMDYTAEQITGKFTSSKGKLYLKGVVYKYSNIQKKWGDMVVEYSFYNEKGRTILLIPRLYEKTYIDISQGESFTN